MRAVGVLTRHLQLHVAGGGAAAEHAANVLEQPRRLRQAATHTAVTTQPLRSTHEPLLGYREPRARVIVGGASVA